ncbi:MAG: Zn-dependent oligopeptidase [Acidobacteria bacterium]|nr:Zn-dependent oligopeptidase [Acidobacteriota bacterium]
MRPILTGILMTTLAAASTVSAQKITDPLHIWVGNPDAASVTAWVQAHLDEVTKYENEILAVKGKHTVENTLKPYDEMQRALGLAGSGPSLLNNASPIKELRDVAQVELQRVSTVGTEISLNRKLYDALADIETSGLDEVTKYYIKRELRDFRLSGVDKDEATRNKIRALQDQLTKLSLTYSRNVAEGTAHIEVKDASELDGLPQDYLDRHKPNEHGVIVITTDEPDYRPVMTYAKSAELRKRMFLTYNNRCYPANKEILLEMVKLRAEMAHLLGFGAWADYASADKMIGSAQGIRNLITELDKAARPAMNKEYAKLLAFAQTKEPGMKAIPDYSVSYYNELYRRANYNFDSQAVRAYFPYAEVEKGVLDTAAKLFHIQFVKVPDAPVWDRSVTVYDVYDNVPGKAAEKGRKLGRIYLDMHPRAGKNKWFNAGTTVSGKRGYSLPEARLNGNFPEPTATDPGLMQYADVVTFFHEFGHMMHGILGGDQPWVGTGPFTIEWDFVEAPSQMLEEFFESKPVLDTFARHYKTGEVIPQPLFDSMIRASAFGRGTGVERQLQLSEYALTIFDTDPAKVDLDAMWYASLAKYSPYQNTPDYHMYATFTHLLGYSSNYYTYQLSKVIALDFFHQFDPKNLLEGPAAMRYRKTVLEPGGSASANTLVKNFLGRSQQYEAMRHWINKEFEGEAAPVK